MNNNDMILANKKSERLYNDINYDNKKCLSKEIAKFVDVMINNFSDKDLTNLYNNINSLDIIIDGGYENHQNSYDPVNNIIYLEKDNAKSAVYHELFHLSSSCYKDDTVFCGFAQWNDDLIIGIGLTEGYTQLLRERYFGDDDLKHAYSVEVNYAYLTELIVGKDKMSCSYLNANLKELTNELCQYNSVEDVINFINAIDYINAYKFKVSDSNEKEIFQNIIDSHRIARKFLLSTYTKKFAEEIKIKALENDQDAITQMTISFYDFVSEIIDNNAAVNMETNEEIIILSTDVLNEIVSSAFGSPDMIFFK